MPVSASPLPPLPAVSAPPPLPSIGFTSRRQSPARRPRFRGWPAAVLVSVVCHAWLYALLADTGTEDGRPIFEQQYLSAFVEAHSPVELDELASDLEVPFKTKAPNLAATRVDAQRIRPGPPQTPKTEGPLQFVAAEMSTHREMAGLASHVKKTHLKKTLVKPNAPPSGSSPSATAKQRQTVLPDVCDETCENRKFGTLLTWSPSAAQASKRAIEFSKLVFLIHISGNFAREEFT